MARHLKLVVVSNIADAGVIPIDLAFALRNHGSHHLFTEPSRGQSLNRD